MRRAESKGAGAGKAVRFAVSMAVLLALAALSVMFAWKVAAAVSITVPYSTTPLADVDLDGNPATGAWADALSVVIPLENGDAGSYGSATLYAKHDGTSYFFRIDGTIDVPWASAAGNHFWLAMQISPTGTSHHGAGTWDGTFFGLWDGTDYAPQPVYPPSPVDTNGFARPPARDASQDAVGRMRYSGASAPYAFTAEWRKPLSPGDANDLTIAMDGTTPYNFFVTTDSDGGGSLGGGLRHNRVTNLNTMRFAAPGVPNTPPTADLTTPDGGELWSGGTAHRIFWNMSDAETATTSLRAWLNLSTDGGATYASIPGAQALTGLSNPCSYLWTVPTVDTAQARVRVTVADPQGATGSDASLANFGIDSTAPAAAAFNPADGAIGVSPTAQVLVTFSEAMNRPSAEQAFSLMRTDTNRYATGTFAWTGNDLTFTPVAALAQGIVYRARVNATARDASDPGNPMAAAASASFTVADVTPPVVTGATAVPSPQEAGGRVNVSAVVTDNGMVGGVWIEVRDPVGALVANASAGYDAGAGRYFHEAGYVQPGTYAFRISAEDAAANWAVSTGNFAIVDTTPPVIQHVPVTQALINAPIRITAAVSDIVAVADVRVDYTDVLGGRFNVSMAVNGTAYEHDIPGQPVVGSVTYFVWATDPSGNAARTPAYTVAVVASDATPPVLANVAATPPIQDPGLSVNITADATDNVALESVSVVVTDPSGSPLGNVTMARLGATDTFYHEAVYLAFGAYAFEVWAVDTSGNAASATGSFTIADRTPPVFQSVVVTPPTQEVGLPVNITADVTDNVAVAGVRVRILDPAGGVSLDASMAGGPGRFWVERAFSATGAYTFALNATDPSGNFAVEAGGFDIVDTTPPVGVAGPDVDVWIGTTVTFDGSASTDNVGIVNYTWSFDHNGTPVTLYGVVAAFRFWELGVHNVTLEVRDAAGLAGTDAMRVTVTSDLTPPAAPRDLVAAATDPECLVLTWEASPDSDLAGYRVYRWNESRGAFDLIADLPPGTTSYTDCGLGDDAPYSYWVIAYDGSGNTSPPSTIADGRTLPRATAAVVSDLWLLIAVALGASLAVLFVALGWRARKRTQPPGPRDGPGTA